ncbi:urease accessory protein UreD [Hoyosella sp. YIM 151337]|uniref:urease accessory protein UreD n=1 Tax=Hoyosella sp. YIM 151337 TaxID=2992742 RepID=UPI002236B8CC|nr:urease accessory protein UreD [Hoyosella sp. YIM 151337]MCW4352992.1 urease accessory protein UreD [Hoyosella sp. YIM 151337]
MRTELVLEAERGRLPRISSAGGLAARLTAPDTVHLIGTAMTPLGGDQIDVRVFVGPGARLTVRSVAATIALPGRVDPHSASKWVFEIADDGYFDCEPEPMIVAGRASHDAVTDVSLTASSTVRLCERVQVGRAGEREQGFWRGTLSTTVDKTPLVVHTLELGQGDVLGVSRALISELEYPGAEEVVFDDTAGGNGVCVPLARGGALRTWLGTELVHAPH